MAGKVPDHFYVTYCIYKNGKILLLGGVYMTKLARARVSYRDDFLIFIFPTKTEKGNITYTYYVCIFQSTEKKRKKEKGQENRSFFLILKLNSKIQRILLTAKSDIFLFLFS